MKRWGAQAIRFEAPFLKKLKITILKMATKNTEEQHKIMVLLGSGGHTGEMMYILSSLKKEYSTQISSVSTNDDSISPIKFTRRFPTSRNFSIPRPRKVGQSYFTSIFTTIYAAFATFILLLKQRPDCIISNGPALCVPFFYLAKIISIFTQKPIKLLYIESLCRISSLSLSGKLVKPICDKFIVQSELLNGDYAEMTS